MTNENRNFENKNVLITGGTSGIGIETARHFVSQGAQVILTGVTEKRIAEAQNEFGNKALVMAADLRNQSRCS
ncbi:SDR family NAD(P)-dependent oxidoreductase [Erwinia sp. PK3-005]